MPLNLLHPEPGQGQRAFLHEGIDVEVTYVIRRSILLVVTVLLVSIITFLVFQILPGDPVRTILGPDADKVQIQTLRSELGLDQPQYVQYMQLIGGLVTGDLGESIRFSRPVMQLIMERLPVTFSLALMSMVIVMVVAVPLGIFSARRERKWSDFTVSTVTQLGMAVPSFFVGMILILYLGMTFQFLAPGGYVPWSESITGALGSLFLPALTIAIPQIAVNFRYVRNAILEQLNLDYVRTARGKGVTEKIVLYKHVLRNSMIPVLTVFGLIFTEVIAGTIIVEQVFALPGVGRLLVTSVNYRDFPVVQGIVIYIALVVVVINFLIDILYSALDPRIRLK